MGIVKKTLILGIALLGIIGSANAAVFVYTDETSYLGAAASNGYSSIVEDFEGDVWIPVRSTAATSVTNKAIKWTSSEKIQTSTGAGRTGYGIFSSPHGTPDTLTGTTSCKIYGVGGWFDTNTPPAKINILLDKIEPAVYEDGADTSGWTIYKGDPALATITSVLDTERDSYVIEFSGDGTNHGYELTGWQNTSQFVIQWSMRYDEPFAVTIDVETTGGQQRFMTYRHYEEGDPNLGADEYGLAVEFGGNKWRTFVRDLQTDLDNKTTGLTIERVNGFRIEGSGRVEDIKLRSAASTELALSTTKQFLAMIDTDGFKSFEILEMEGTVTDQKKMFADDFTFALTCPPADFNCDGNSDILWRHSVTGANVIWEMTGTARSSYAWLETVADTNWGTQ